MVGFGGSHIYSHTNMPNRTCYDYTDSREEGRAMTTLINASSNHPGGVNMASWTARSVSSGTR